ncbi:MAG TPA: TetR/AcrR family transcriptional regulator [Terriglobales bacterium]|nr:TetR/AcrR family transcriptional regulator [Terriglobales bacterium]
MAQTRQASKTKTSAVPDEQGRVSRRTIANGSRVGDKYQRIIEAAIDVIAERGFHNSRVSDIAERANVADGTVYLYFKSKEQILMTALDSAFQGFYRQAQKELEQSSDATSKLRILARLHLRELSNHRSLAVVLQTELRQSAKFLAEFSQRELKGYFNLIREIIREGQAAGSIRGDISDKIAAACFFGALDELVTAWVLSTREHNLSSAADPVVDLLLSGMEARV